MNSWDVFLGTVIPKTYRAGRNEELPDLLTDKQLSEQQGVLTMLRPAIFSTEDPPVPVESLELHEYIQALRRRIEVQNDLAVALAKELKEYREEVDKLSLDLGIKNQEVPAGENYKEADQMDIQA